jgi:hypothetical protein
MAFTSETILKFGSTAIEFAVVTLLNYSLENEKAGAFNYRRKESISVTGYFSNRESSVPISEHFRQIKLLLENSTDFIDLKLNDLSYGKVRFLNFTFPTSVNFDENAVRFSKFTITMEVFKDDSSGTFASANLPTAVGSVTTSWYKVKAFTESFSFTLQEDGNFLASHSLSFGIDNIDKQSPADVTKLANSIANTFFAQGLDSLSSIRSLYSSTNFQVSNTDYGSSLVNQTSDIINYQYSYGKNYTVFSDNSSTTTETLTNDISYMQDGIIQIVERGRIKGKGDTREAARQNALAKLEANLATAYTRCNSYFTSYFSTYYSRFAANVPKIYQIETLKTNPISINKDLGGVETEVGYDITFTSSGSYSSPTRINSFSVSLTKNPRGIVEASIEGSVKYYTNKNQNFDKISDFKTNIIDSPSISDIATISPYYKKLMNSANNYAGSKISLQIQYLKFGVEIQYTKAFSDSPTIQSAGALVSELNISESTNLPVNRFSTVNVPNYKEVIYQTRQLSEGNKNISIAMKINRETLFSGSSAGSNQDPAVVFPKIKTLMTTNMLNKTSGYLFGTSPIAVNAFAKIFNQGTKYKKGELTYFLENFRLTFDSSYTLTADLSFKFLAEREKI